MYFHVWCSYFLCLLWVRPAIGEDVSSVRIEPLTRTDGLYTTLDLVRPISSAHKSMESLSDQEIMQLYDQSPIFLDLPLFDNVHDSQVSNSVFIAYKANNQSIYSPLLMALRLLLQPLHLTTWSYTAEGLQFDNFNLPAFPVGLFNEKLKDPVCKYKHRISFMKLPFTRTHLFTNLFSFRQQSIVTQVFIWMVSK